MLSINITITFGCSFSISIGIGVSISIIAIVLALILPYCSIARISVLVLLFFSVALLCHMRLGTRSSQKKRAWLRLARRVLSSGWHRRVQPFGQAAGDGVTGLQGGPGDSSGPPKYPNSKHTLCYGIKAQMMGTLEVQSYSGLTLRLRRPSGACGPVIGIWRLRFGFQLEGPRFPGIRGHTYIF